MFSCRKRTDILYTSGTTGRPKGAVLTHKNILINGLVTSMEVVGSPEERWLCVTPIFHSAACATVIKMLLIGGTIFIVDQFDPGEVLKMVEQEQITYLFLVPAMWIMLLESPEIKKHDTSSLRRALTGASVMPVEVKAGHDAFSKCPHVRLLRADGDEPEFRNRVMTPDSLRTPPCRLDEHNE